MLRAWLVLIALCIALPGMSTDARAAGAADARQFTDSLGQKVLGALNAPSISADQKQKQMQQLFSDSVDIGWMGQFALGPGWRQATPQQRDSYMQAYHDYMLARYTTRFADYSGSKYKITGVQEDGNGQFTVGMTINRPKDQQEVQAGYHLHVDGKGQFKIADIIIEGVSLITTQRSEFTSVVQQGGIDKLITDLQSKQQAEQQKQ